MQRFYLKLFNLLVILIFLAFQSSFAQGVNDALRLGLPSTSSDARALGMGDSYIGLSDGAGAAEFNPAGFGLLNRMEISGGIDYLNYNNNTTFLNQYTNYSNSATRLSNFSFALPFPTTQGSLVFAVAYHNTHDYTGALKFNGYNGGNTSMIQDLNANTNIPYDLFLTDTNFNTPINGHLNQSGTILQSGSTNNWTFSGAIEVYKNLFLGLNLNIISGSYENNNSYYEDDLNGYYANVQTDPNTPATKGFKTFYLNKLLDWNISGWDAKFGLLYQLKNLARFGITVQFPKTYTVKENFNVSGYSQFATGQSYNLDPTKYSDQVQYDIVTPFELGGGAAVNFQSLILSAQATFVDYTQLKFENPSGLSTDYVASKNQNIKDQLRSVVNYNIGAEYTFSGLGLRLRAGYFVQPSAYQGDASKYDKKYYTFGIGYLADNSVGIDLAFAHGSWSNYGDNYGVDVSRTYQDISTNKFILSTTYRF
ncbi:MAG: OmpP1/FadL family transporter [Ignavibacteriaceae bacterium]